MVVGVSEDTIRRRLRDRRIPGACRDASGAWSIPVDGLNDAGLRARRQPSTSALPNSNGVSAGAERSRVEAVLEEHISDLRREAVALHALLLRLTSLMTPAELLARPGALDVAAEETVPDTRPG